MNRSFYVHGSWTIIAITCFVLGNHLASSRETTVTGADETELTAREHRLGSSGSSSTSIGSTSRNRLSTGRLAESEPLNSAKIDSLARGFLSSKNPSEKRLVFAELLKGLTPENAESIFEQILDQNSSSLLHRDFHFMWGSKAGAEAVLAAGKAPDSTVLCVLCQMLLPAGLQLILRLPSPGLLVPGKSLTQNPENSKKLCSQECSKV